MKVDSEFLVSTQHGEAGTVFTIVRTFSGGAGWEPIGSVRPGQWVGARGERMRIIGPSPTRGYFTVDHTTWGMGITWPAQMVARLIYQEAIA